MSNKSILFADDSATMRHIAEKTFAAEPYSVTTVPSGEGAIAKAKEIRPDIIIVDAGMPGFSGYDVCKAVRKDTALGTTPVIIMSGVSNLYDEAKGREAGITEHMKKPFDTGLLIEMVQNLVSAAALAQEESLEYADQEEDLEPISEMPEPDLKPEPDLERLSEPPIPLASPVMRYSAEAGPRVSSAADLKTAGKQTQEYARPSSPPPQRITADISRPQIEIEPAPTEMDEEETFGQEADFGDEAVDVAEPSDVPPLEFDSRDTEDHSGSFHVGTLAELAQMDSRGIPIDSERHDDAIEISPTASSLASLGPRMAPKVEVLPEIEADASPDTISEIPDMPDEEEPIPLPEKSVSPSPASLPSETAASATSKAARPPFASIPSPVPAGGAASISAGAPKAASVGTRVDAAAEQIASSIEGITPIQAAAIQTLTREIIERVVWEVVPDLAELIIKEELSKLLKE